MQLKAIYGLGALLLLSLASVKAYDHDDFKQKFGNEFITDMKHYHAELLRQDMEHYKSIYETLLSDFEPTREQENTFKQRLATVRDIQQGIGNSVTIDLIKKVKSFGSDVIMELVFLSINPDTRLNPTKHRVIKKALADNAALEHDDLKEFQRKIYKRYHEMYETIPEEELNANPEYRKIDLTMERVLKNRSRDMSSILEYLSIYKLLADFFDVPEYKELFNV